MKCFNCGGSGHTAKNCKKAVICHKCKKTGHISSNCPQTNNNFNHQRNNNRGNNHDTQNNNINNRINENNGNDADIKCYNCGKIGHKTYDCPQKKGKLCYICGNPGHISSNCPQKNNKYKNRQRMEDKGDDKKSPNNIQINDDDENNKVICPICFVNSNSEKKFQVSKCGHILCKLCWDKILINKKICPICKKNVNKNDLVEIFI